MNSINSQIEVGNYSIDVHLKNIKNMHLAVYPPTGRIRISAPLETDLERIRLFAISKLNWIKKHQANFNKQVRQPESEFLTGESHYYLGNRYLLKSKRAISDELKPETIYMNDVSSVFYFKDDTVLYIWSDEGVYNNRSLNMEFNKNVKAKYLNSDLFAEKAFY